MPDLLIDGLIEAYWNVNISPERLNVSDEEV